MDLGYRGIGKYCHTPGGETPLIALAMEYLDVPSMVTRWMFDLILAMDYDCGCESTARGCYYQEDLNYWVYADWEVTHEAISWT